MRRLWFVMLCVFLTSGMVQAQTGTITGVVKDESGALPAANIFIKGTRIGGLSERNGKFEIKNVPVGDQILVVSYIGYEDQELMLKVRAGEVTGTGSVILKASSFEMGEILVQSTYRHGQQRARAMERNAPAIVNILAADAIGKLPDRNAAEAIQRMPGVQIERDQGEGRYVTVRGAPGPWSSTLINGTRIPDARGGSRDIALDIFPSNFIEYVEVVKALTPDQEGDAIGGSVNMLTRMPAESQTLDVTLSGGWHNQAQSGMYLTSARYSNRTADGKFGIVISGTVNSRDWGSDNYEIGYGSGGALNELQLRDYLGNRTTYGTNWGMEWQVGERTQLYSSGIFSVFHDDEMRFRNRYHFGNKRFEMAFTDTKYRSSLTGGNVGLKHSFSDAWDMDVNVYSNRSWYGYDSPGNLGDDQHGYYYVTFRQSGVTYENLASDGKKYLGSDAPDANYQADHYENIQPHISSTTPIDANKLIFQNAISSFYETTGEDFASTMNFTHHMKGDSKLKFGGKFRWQQAEQERRLFTWAYEKTATLADFPRFSFPDKGGFLTEINEVYNALLIDYPTRESVNNAHMNAAFEPTLIERNETNSNLATSNFDVTENQGAGYVMGEFELSERWRLVPGVRMEYTDSEGNGYAWLDESSLAVPTKSTKNYWAILPMANLSFKPKSDLDIRAAFTRSFARPNFNDLAPFERVDELDATVSRGNPDLEATFAWNYDLLATYYFNSLSAVSGGVFYKDISNLISTASSQASLTYNGQTQTYRITQPVNNESASLWGFELGYSQALSNLPGFWNGFGFGFNYTYTKSETTIPGRRTEFAPLANQSPHTFNGQVFYEKSGVSLRLAANYRSPYIDDYTEDASGDRWRDRAFNMDFNASYQMNKRTSLFFEVTNLTNDPLRYYNGENRSDRPEQVEFYSRRGNVGLNYSFF